MKVLMSAYACNPIRGSEPGVGWNWAIQAARFHEVWVLTRANNRDAIEAELARRPVENLHFVYHDLPRWACFWKRGGRGVYPYYLLWQFTALPAARRLHRRVQFDVAHHITFVTIRFPSFLSCLEIPYVWGPIGGGERPPRHFYRSLGPAGVVKQALRDLSNLLVRLDPLVRITARNAQLILTTTRESAQSLPAPARRRAEVLPAIGLPAHTPYQSLPFRSADTCRILYVGRLIYWKGLQFALPALARVAESRPNVTLTVIGDGGFGPSLRKLADRHGVSKIVHFVGQLPRDAVLDLYQSHDVFLFPSLQDSGGFAVLEAMGAGLPVVCLDLGGPALAVTDAAGIRIPASNPEQVIADLASAIERLAADPMLRRSMGESGRRRVAEAYTWDRKGDLLHQLYSRAGR